VTISAQSVKKAERPRVVTTLETKLEIILNSEAGERVVNIGLELGIRIVVTGNTKI
jgi:hypothetical protein